MTTVNTIDGPPVKTKRHFGRWFRDGALAGALLGISAAIAIAKPQFLAGTNLINVARQISITGPLAVGATIVLLTGGVDLSQGSVAALAGVVAASFGHLGQGSVAVPICAGVATGAACGLVNGLVVTRAQVAGFIATLGMMTAARGLALILSGGMPISNLDPSFLHLAGGSFAGVPRPVLVFAAIALCAHVFLRHFRPGRYIYAVGGNELSAYAAGISVGGTKRLAFLLSGASAGLCGVVLAARTTTGQPNAGVGYELDAIAAAVIGGTSLNGGLGGIGGTVLGALLIGVINNGLDLTNVPSYYQQIAKGAIIVTAVALDGRRVKSAS
jgi:inositol transport system permease protein